MDFGDLDSNFAIIIGIVLLLVINILTRRRKKERTPQEIAFGLLSDIQANQRLAEGFQHNLNVGTFKVGSWQRNYNKLDFLDMSLQTTLASTFSMAEGFNRDIESAKKSRSTTYLSGIDVSKLKQLLVKSREGLEQSLQPSSDQQQPS